MRLLLLALAGLISASSLGISPPAHSEPWAFSLTPGLGRIRLDEDLGAVKEYSSQIGAILTLSPSARVMLDGRAHFTRPGLARQRFRAVLHGEINAALFPFARFDESSARPYVTGGLGAARLNSRNRFAWNLGGGVELGRPEGNLSIRADARVVSFKTPPRTGADLVRNLELFVGVSLNGLSLGPGERRPSVPVTTSDSDQDGVLDHLDRCLRTLEGARVDSVGCHLDSDGDGVPDGLDEEDNTPSNAFPFVGRDGRAIDSDGDGVLDGADKCPRTPPECEVESATGCELDADGDGVCDAIDRCAETPSNERVDLQGCAVSTAALMQELERTGRIVLALRFLRSGAGGRLAVAPESQGALDMVGGILCEGSEPEIAIQAYPRGQRNDPQRARAVFDYLTGNFPCRYEQFTLPPDTGRRATGQFEPVTYVELEVTYRDE